MEDETGIVLRKVRADGIVMSRVPKRIRDNFIKLADEEFAGDYGMTLTFLWNNFELLNSFIQSWDTKLNYLITLNENNNQTEMVEKKPGKSIRLMSGRTVKGGDK